MTTSLIYGNHVFAGTVIFSGTVTLPDGTVDDDAVVAGADLGADKLVHRHSISWAEASTVEATAQTFPIYIASFAALVKSIDVACVTDPSHADNTTTVDLHRSTAGGAFATVLSTTAELNSTTGDLTVVAGVVNTSLDDLIDGDILALVVTLGSDSGDYAKGLMVTVNVDEQPTA